MATLTIRLSDEKHQRIRAMAEKKNISINKLFEEFSTIALAEHDAETRFLMLAASGDPQRGLRLLEKLDNSYQQ